MIQGGRVSVGGHATGGLSAPFNSKPKSMLTEMPPPQTLQSPPPLPVRTAATESLNPASKPVEVIALLKLFDLLLPGGDGACEAAAGACCPERCFLPQRMSERGEEDVSLPKLRSAAHGAASSWSERHRISGEVWRFWEGPGLGTDCLASVDADGPSTSRQPSSSKGFSGSPSSVPRAGVYGCRTSRHWTSSIAGGRSPIHWRSLISRSSTRSRRNEQTWRHLQRRHLSWLQPLLQRRRSRQLQSRVGRRAEKLRRKKQRSEL